MGGEEIVRVAAVLGPRVRLDVLSAVLDLDRERSVEAIDALVERGVLRDAGEGVLEVSSQALEGVGPARRAALHARAFEHLAALGHVEAAARHAVEGHLLGEPRAVEVVREAGRRAVAAGDLPGAVALLRGAQRLGAGAEPVELLEDLAEALLASGAPQEAADVSRQALERPGLEGTDRSRILRLLARALAYCGDLEGSAWASGHALEQVAHDPVARAAVLEDRLHVLWQSGGPGAAMRFMDGVSWEGPAPGLDSAVAFMRFWATGDAAAAAVLERLSDEAARAPEHGSAPFQAQLTFMSVARYLERLDEDDLIYAQARARASAEGALHALAPLDVSHADTLTRRGELDAALAVLDGIDPASIEGLMAQPVAVSRAYVLTELGRAREAAACLPHVGDELTWMTEIWTAHFRGRIALLRRQADEAHARYLALEERFVELGIALPVACLWASAAIEAHLEVGAHEDVARVCAWLEEHPTEPATWPRMVALAGRAALAREDGEALYEQAVALECPLVLERGRVLVRFAALLRRGGQRLRARPLAAEALENAERAGAEPLARAAAAELTAAGGRRRPDPRADEELTEREAQVARLAAQGLTTKEIAADLFVSPKTVETHLGRVYAKLGVRSKRALRGRADLED